MRDEPEVIPGSVTAPAAAPVAPVAAAGSASGLHTSQELAQAFSAHGDAVSRSLRRLVADPETVRDLAQETFLRAWRLRETYDPERSPLRPWLLLLARSVAVEHMRSQRVRPWHRLLRTPREDDDCGHDPTEHVLASWIIEEEVRRLPLKLRQVVIETQIHDRPHADVAADLGIPVGTVRSRLFHALRAMRTSLESQGFVP